MDLKTFGQMISARREAMGMDQTALAEASGMSVPYISRLENGGVLNPKLFDLAAVAKVLDVSIAPLFSMQGVDLGRRIIAHSKIAPSVARVAESYEWCGPRDQDLISRVLEAIADRYAAGREADNGRRVAEEPQAYPA